MESYLADFFSISIKLLALTTSPAVLTAFLSGTKSHTPARKKATAIRTGAAVFSIALILYLFGDTIFNLFGFTLDAFRIGSGCLLFMTAVALMNEKPQSSSIAVNTDEDEGDISVVPLAIPICMGPASIGTVMVLGASATSTPERLVGAAAMLTVATLITLALFTADKIERMLGKTGMVVLSKLTGLLLSAIAAQVVFTGIRNFMLP